ncbi:carbohydrate binding domain-containing protein [Marinimicrobium alkaliphilum]|uniref:carbohydrate binding domain-containing protein n=1 Tax=Marinimicrobium alkaliphilum TaxID=2202654 RepID=UPI000DB98A94|nr:carbohydrate binding domain-containing protein [Marinimicrobium alkaliphilum]
MIDPRRLSVRLMVTLGGLLLLLVFPFFFFTAPDWGLFAFYPHIWGPGHIGFFFLLFLVIQTRVPLPTWRHWLWASMAVMALSVAIEAIQAQVGRNACWYDVLRNLIGTWLALAWAQRPSLPIWGVRVVVSGLFLWQLMPLIGDVQLHRDTRRALPVLADFEQPLDRRQWRGELARVVSPVSVGESSLAVTLPAHVPYPGAVFDRVATDWRGYDALRFDIHNPQAEPLRVSIRIDDLAHDRRERGYADRFNRLLVAEPGWNHYRIPLSDIEQAPQERTLDLHRIQRIYWFTRRLDAPQRFYLDNIHLE